MGLSFTPACNFGAGQLKLLKIRMKAIDNIRKITKAMKMIAQTRMKAQTRILDNGKNFGLGSVQKLLDNETYLQKKLPEYSIKKSLIVPVTSDKGLCGGCNSAIVR